MRSALLIYLIFSKQPLLQSLLLQSLRAYLGPTFANQTILLKNCIGKLILYKTSKNPFFATLCLGNELTKIHRCGFRITRAAISRNSNSCAFNDKLVSPPESRSPGWVAHQAVIECPTVAIPGLMAAGLISPSSRLGPDYSRCAPLSNTALYNNGRGSEVGFQHPRHARSSPDNTNKNQINQKLLN